MKTEKTNDGVRRLALAVIIRAARDAGFSTRKNRSIQPTEREREAKQFLKNAVNGGKESFWFALAGVQPENILEGVEESCCQ